MENTLAESLEKNSWKSFVQIPLSKVPDTWNHTEMLQKCEERKTIPRDIKSKNIDATKPKAKHLRLDYHQSRMKR